jgi:pimeloyl-[acyl-carrier protein] methyl ester esterase
MPYFKTKNGINWHYDVEGSGDPLLFLHGWGVDMRIWRQQAKHFSQHDRVLTLDLPGHGKSSWHRLDLEALARGVLAVLDEVKMEKVFLVGSSFGGLIGLKMFQLEPGRFRKLTLVGTTPKMVRPHSRMHGVDQEHLEKLTYQLETNYPEIVNIFFRSLFTQKERESRRFKWLQRFRQNIGLPQKQALLNFLEIMSLEDMRDALFALYVPLQLISGTEDYICSYDMVESLRALLPAARVDYFKDCGHFPFLSRPHEFNTALEEFLRS